MRIGYDVHRVQKVCLIASIAQLVEQLICNQQVVGSSPTGSSKVDSSVDGNQSGVVPLEWKHPLQSVYWCRGPTCLPVTQETTSSNLVYTATAP